jgi:GT2 family glycosyltransferase
MSTVAVVLCNYNHAKYLQDSLRHICQQDRPADQIVVIDDGSTDNSWAIIQQFARDNPNVEAYSNGQNLGLEASIAKALAKVRCDYLVWTAADDRLLKHFLARNMEVLSRHPQAALSFSEVVVLKGDSEETDHYAANPASSHIFNHSELPDYVSPDNLRQRMQLGYLPIASNTCVVRVSLIKGLGGFPAALRWFADSFTYTLLAMRHGACVISEPLAFIRSHDGHYSQAMHDKTKQAVVLNAIFDMLNRADFRDIRAFMKSCPSNLTPYEPFLKPLLLKRPKDWDILATYVAWEVLTHKKRTGASWPILIKHAALLTLRKLGLKRNGAA